MPLSVRQVQEIEKAHPEGLSSKQILELFEAHGERLSEATLRKYVQLGLLPRSRRVGEKGKHRGSRGIYPVEVVRRISDIRRAMEGGRTLESLARAAQGVSQRVDAVRAALDELTAAVDAELARPMDRGTKASLKADWTQLARDGRNWTRGLAQLVAALETAEPKPNGTKKRGGA